MDLKGKKKKYRTWRIEVKNSHSRFARDFKRVRGDLVDLALVVVGCRLLDVGCWMSIVVCLLRL